MNMKFATYTAADLYACEVRAAGRHASIKGPFFTTVGRPDWRQDWYHYWVVLEWD